MPEHQNIEYKESWRDEYLKWVCGFANANGGKIYIGKDDKGKVVGVKDYKRLMEDIPNKIHDILGLVVDVNLKRKGRSYFIEIVVPPYSVPISYKGRYYYRTGSIKRELTGNSLNEFLLKKTGRTWDEVVEPRAKFSDIDKKSVKKFLESAAQAKRFPVDKKMSIKELFSKLKLTENGKLRRAALVLFAKDPRDFFPTMYIQIGRFRKTKVNLLFQEVVEGNLIQSLEETLNILDRKFFISPVSFEGIHRIEKWQYPLPALREIILNILVHRNYIGAHTQIAVYDDGISFWNDGGLPVGWTIENLIKKHESKPRNPIIANACFLGGYIDAWGRGIEKIIEACRQENLPDPEFDDSSGFKVTLYSNLVSRRDYGPSWDQVGTKLRLSREQVSKRHLELGEQVSEQVFEQVSEQVKRLLYAISNGKYSTQELMVKLNIKHRPTFLYNYLKPALERDLVEMTIPNKPRSSRQRYRLTDKGRVYLERL